MELKDYVRDHYSRYWLTARRDSVKPGAYDDTICALLLRHAGTQARVLEVAIGTGEPFAAALAARGHAVSGVDLSPVLVDACRRVYPRIDCRVGDAEAIPFGDAAFDLTYCVHASWYFPDLAQAIGEMIRVTRPGGHVVFDVMNGSNAEIQDEYRRHVRNTRGVWRLWRLVRQAVKAVTRRGVPDWHAVVFLHPTDPLALTADLRRRGHAVEVLGRRADACLESVPEPSDWSRFSRLVVQVSC